MRNAVSYGRNGVYNSVYFRRDVSSLSQLQCYGVYMILVSETIEAENKLPHTDGGSNIGVCRNLRYILTIVEILVSGLRSVGDMNRARQIGDT